MIFNPKRKFVGIEHFYKISNNNNYSKDTIKLEEGEKISDKNANKYVKRKSKNCLDNTLISVH